VRPPSAKALWAQRAWCFQHVSVFFATRPMPLWPPRALQANPDRAPYRGALPSPIFCGREARPGRPPPPPPAPHALHGLRSPGPAAQPLLPGLPSVTRTAARCRWLAGCLWARKRGGGCMAPGSAAVCMGTVRSGGGGRAVIRLNRRNHRTVAQPLLRKVRACSLVSGFQIRVALGRAAGPLTSASRAAARHRGAPDRCPPLPEDIHRLALHQPHCLAKQRACSTLAAGPAHASPRSKPSRRER
jgi:hypothetical protein